MKVEKSASLAPALRSAVCAAAFAVVSSASAEIEFNAGADLRIRQELLKNAPGLPGGGVVSQSRRGPFTNHMRFRPRVWGEISALSEDFGEWRVYTRLADEFRWCPEPYKNTQTFPGEVIIDNLFLEGKGVFDGFLDLRLGRQDLYNYCGLDHIFIDGTPGDGSRTVYTDMAAFKLHFTEVSTLDLFALYNFDDCDVRWGTKRSKHLSLSGLGGGAEPEMDDWGVGAIWGSELAPWLPYQLFVLQKNTHEFMRGGVEHPWTQREVLGAKVVPQLDEEWFLQFEAMGQIGRNGDHDTLTGWSTYEAIGWKCSTESSIKPYARLGHHFMSGDGDAAKEDGGHSAWDPVWSRGVNDSEMFLYGTHYGAAWWSNQHFLKMTAGLNFGRAHRVEANTGPLFAAVRDGLGGGDGYFKGYFSQLRYDFPLWLADKEKGERFEVVGHVMAELFNPGDYFETDKPAYFFRWQVEFKF